MTPSSLIRWSGLAAALGGALWVAVFAVYASRPSGPGSGPPYGSFEGLGVPGPWCIRCESEALGPADQEVA
jgi:hypothetical protein